MNKSILIALFPLVILSASAFAKDEAISAENDAVETNQGLGECANKTTDCLPRRKTISSSINEFKYAAYIDSWRIKVERIGGINYPEEARKSGVFGTLILDVGINSDGTLDSIAVKRSSGHKVLDAAAIRTVRLAAPFSPFPESIRNEVDILHITKKWIYQKLTQEHTPASGME